MWWLLIIGILVAYMYMAVTMHNPQKIRSKISENMLYLHYGLMQVQKIQEECSPEECQCDMEAVETLLSDAEDEYIAVKAMNLVSVKDMSELEQINIRVMNAMNLVNQARRKLAACVSDEDE